MKVRILYGYRGARTKEQFLAPGIHEVDDSFGEYLIENGHATIMEPSPPAPEKEPETPTEAEPAKRPGRKRARRTVTPKDKS